MSAAIHQPGQIGDGVLSAARERLVLGLLASIQFLFVMDFMIVMPLGPQFIQVFGITPKQFGWIVSVYAVSAASATILASLGVDKFDRKHVLLAAIVGYIVGVGFCAMAQSFSGLLLARCLTGAFSGIGGSVIYAIVSDLIPLRRRGTAMGILMSAFPLSSILGLPLGLFLANAYSWNAPFQFLFLAAIPVGGMALLLLPSVRGHIQAQREEKPALVRFVAILANGNHLRAFGLSACLTFSGSLVFPYISPHLILNVGILDSQLPWIYLVGGAATLLSTNLVGRLADTYGHSKVFKIMVVASFFPVVAITNLPVVPFGLALLVSTLMMVTGGGRFPPGMALVTGAVRSSQRGSFLSMNTATQYLFSGLGAFIASFLVFEAEGGGFGGYSRAGVLSVLVLVVAILLSNWIKPFQESPKPAVSGHTP